MARSPLHSADVVEKMLGARGYLAVTSDNRKWVRSWLTANGVASTLARALTLSDLAAVYNDHSDTLLNGYKARSVGIQDDEQDDDEQQQTETVKAAPEATTTPEPKKNGHAHTERRPDTKSAAEKLSAGLSAMLAEIMARPAGLDEERVTELARALINKEMSSARIARLIEQYAPAITVKIEKAEPREIKIEGARHASFPRIVRMVGAGLNVSMVGPAGSGKTTLAHQVADALGLEFEFTGAIASEYKLAGFIDAQGRYVSTAFRRAFEQGRLFLFDEVDASLPAALLAFNAALANGYADFPDGKVKRHPNFRAIAAANTYWTGQDRVYVGRNQLDGASLDRFAFIELPYDEKLERQIAGDTKFTTYVQKARRAAAEQKIRHVISPRASMFGNALIAAGDTMDEAADAVLWKGLDVATVNKIKAAIR